jgi:hypothetical protein
MAVQQEEWRNVVFPSLASPIFSSSSSGAGSLAAALNLLRLTNRFQAACEIAQAACKAFERQAVLRPAFG